MSAVDNSTLSRRADAVFANSTAYHAELPMAGRRAESESFLAALELQEGARLVTISAALGSGKTFFLNEMLGRHAQAAPGFDERRNAVYWLATEFVVPGIDDGAAVDLERVAESEQLDELAGRYDASFTDVDGLRILLLEELDRKATLAQVAWSIAAAVRWLGLGGDRLLVLTGDALIRGTTVQRLVERVEQRSHIELEPLHRALLAEAVALRIEDKVLRPIAPKLSDEQRQAAAKEAAGQLLDDYHVLWSTVPESAPNVLATFREGLGALRQMSGHAPASRERIVFPSELVRALQQDARAPGGVASKLEEALLGYVTTQIEDGRPIEPMSIAQLAERVDAAPDDRFRRRGIDAIARAGLLTPVGIPFEEADERGLPIALAEPFVPSYRLLHRALSRLVGT